MGAEAPLKMTLGEAVVYPVNSFVMPRLSPCEPVPWPAVSRRINAAKLERNVVVDRGVGIEKLVYCAAVLRNRPILRGVTPRPPGHEALYCETASEEMDMRYSISFGTHNDPIGQRN